MYYWITSNKWNDNYEGWGEITFYTIIFLPVILYYPILEFFTKGRTVGKALMKLRVANVNGKPAAFSEIILRWLLRMIDTKIGVAFFLIAAFFETFSNHVQWVTMIGVFTAIPFPIIGIISIIISKNNQRIGDLAADTIVVYNQKRISLEETILRHKSEDYIPIFKQVLKLRDKDIYIIKKVVDQASHGDHSKVIPLAKKAKLILEVKSDLLPLIFLKTLMKDYNHLAQEKDL